MKKKKSKINFLKWTPRVLAILFILFISMFALDAFNEDYTLVEMIAGFLIHLIPSYLLIAATVVGWKNNRNGAIMFVALGIASLIFFRTYSHILSFSIITLPCFVIGGLFYIAGKKEKKKK
ncbi:hypothetical protein JXC34_05385 [Candidatus Woesearchaeota archaeon]|nr:hypothetical protein [Candidatus Woesearchaeota archaeon]